MLFDSVEKGISLGQTHHGQVLSNFWDRQKAVLFFFTNVIFVLQDVKWQPEIREFFCRVIRYLISKRSSLENASVVRT